MKVLIIQNKILHYRIPLYQGISEFCELSIAHSGKKVGSNGKFKEHILETKSLFGFKWQKGVKKLAKRYDVIIAMFDIRWLSTLNLLLRKTSNQKIYLWGIGVSSENGLGRSRKFDFIRFKYGKLADGIIFYSDYPIKIYQKRGFLKSQLHTANNTVEVSIDTNYNKRYDYFLFIGSLHKRKKIDDLIHAYYHYKFRCKNYKKLKIIGDGEEKHTIRNLVEKLGLQDDIELCGRINDPEIKKELFGGAIASISPGQAGLAVLESLGHGVPFITYKDAITGGEFFNIKDNINGYTLGCIEDITEIMYLLTENLSMCKILSENSSNHYKEKGRMIHMVNSFKRIIF